MGALGALGAEFNVAGEVSIGRLAEQFSLIPQEVSRRPDLVSLLDRLNWHCIQTLGQRHGQRVERVSTAASGDECLTSSSC